MQFAAAVAADGDQCLGRPRYLPAWLTHAARKREVHQTRAVSHQIFDRLVRGESLACSSSLP